MTREAWVGQGIMAKNKTPGWNARRISDLGFCPNQAIVGRAGSFD